MTDRYEYEKRLREFDGPLARVAMNNPCVHRIVKLYATGEIVTREEALSQMVVQLAKNWDEAMKASFEATMNNFRSAINK